MTPAGAGVLGLGGCLVVVLVLDFSGDVSLELVVLVIEELIIRPQQLQIPQHQDHPS